MKIKLHFVHLFFLFFIISKSNSQTYILYGDKTFGGNNDESPVKIFQVNNSQFMLLGISSTNVNGDKTEPYCDSLGSDKDEWLLKTDTSFTILWDRSIGGSQNELLSSFTETGNNKYVFSCTSGSNISCEKSENSVNNSNDYWICSVDSNGNKVWDKTIGGTDHDESPQIIRLVSGDCILAGRSESPIGADKTVPNFGDYDYWVIKLDSSGNKLWDKVYGGTGEEIIYSQYTPAFSVFKDIGTDFILAGSTFSPLSGNISDTSRGDFDMWLIKLDSAGNIIWDKRYGGSGGDFCARIIHTDDNGYMVCGSTVSPQGLDISDSSKGFTDVWLLKLDSLGNKQWDRRYGGTGPESGTWIEKAPGGGYWVSGFTASDTSFDVSELSYGAYDYWIFKIDSAGNKLFDKRFGGPGLDYGTNFIIMPDSSIFLCGYASSGISAVKTDSGKGGKDYWLVHFKYTDTNTGINENANENNAISIFPNPTKGKFILNNNSKTNGDIFINDAIGKEVYCKKNLLLNHYEIDISSFDKGVYFLKVKTGERFFTKKILKM